MAVGWSTYNILYLSTTSPCVQSGREEDSSPHSLPEHPLPMCTEWPRGGQLMPFSTRAPPSRVYRVAEGWTAHAILYQSTTFPCVQSGRGEDSSQHSLPERPLPLCTEWPRGGQLTTFFIRAPPPPPSCGCVQSGLGACSTRAPPVSLPLTPKINRVTWPFLKF